MKTNIKAIEDRVLDLLDENRTLLDSRVEYCDPGVTLSLLIAGFVDDAARVVLSSVDAARIDECRHLTAVGMRTVHTGPDTAVVTLPADFLRLIYFRMSDWPRGVSVPLAWGSEQHSLRSSRYVRGGLRTRRPGAVALRYRGDIRELEVYGTAAGSHVAEFDWLDLPRLRDGWIDLPPGLVGEVCSKIAEMVRLTVGTD